MDLPPEVLLGQADSNHWSAWQIEESALKVHIEPACELITDALTRKFLQPAMQAMGTEDWAAYFVGFDTSDLRLRPDHSADAIQLYDRLELSGEAARRETGFEESDAPDDDEVQTILLRKTAMGGGTPEMTSAALEKLGVDLFGTAPPEQVEAPALQPSRVPSGTPPPPLPPAPEVDRGIPEQAASALLAAAEVSVLRAVERARNRLRHRSKQPRPCEPDKLDLVLADAWEHIPRVAHLCGRDPVALTATLDRYTRALLTEGIEHEPEVLRRVLFDARP